MVLARELRGKLVRESITLASLNWSETFYVEADASTAGIAAVLSQVDAASGNLRPIRYFSSALTAAQRNYSEAQLDAWALVAPARKWAVYLRAAPEVVFLTDHCPLQWLRRRKDPWHT